MTILGLALPAAAGCGPDRSSASGPPGPSVAGTAASSPGAVSLPTNGQCALIPTEKAATLIGATPTSSSASVGADDGPALVRVDGCTHVSPAGNLGYDVNDVSGAGIDGATIVHQASMEIGAAPEAKSFDVPGGDASMGFIMPIGPKFMARLEVAKGKYTIGVNAVFSDAGKAQQVALAAAAILVAAVS